MQNITADRDVYGYQARYIDKWIVLIQQLAQEIHTIAELRKNEVVVKGIDLLWKFTKKCRKFSDSLSLHKIEEMKSLQANTNMEESENEIEEFNQFASSFKYQDVHQNERAKIHYHIHQESQETSTTALVSSAFASVVTSIASSLWTVATSAIGWGISQFFS